MGLFDWIKQVFVNKYDNIEEHTLSIQKWIMQTIVILFITLLGTEMFINYRFLKENYAFN